MKRRKILLAALVMSIPTLNGCSLLGDKSLIDLIDPLCLFHKIYPEIIISGSMNKKNYQFTDEWDLTGLTIKTKDKNGNITTLGQGEYTITPEPSNPKGFFGSLSLKVQVSGFDSIKETISDITVGKEQYNSANEINAYYSDLPSSPTLAQLQEHSFTKHTTWIKYGEVDSYYRVSDTHRSIDEIPDKYKYEAFYTGRETTFSTKASKEHVWACANSNNLYTHNSSAGTHYVDNKEYVGAGSDLYHIRPCVGIVNTARGNCIFTELNGFSDTKVIQEKTTDIPFTIYGYSTSSNGTPQYADKAEPGDKMKGDVARTLAYVYMHYSTNAGNHGGDYCGNLNLSNVLSAPSKYGSVGKMLVAWNKFDPVSETEKYRNHTIQQIQGNRNPFVDHPEWLDSLFG